MLNAQLRISDVKMTQSGSATRLLYVKQLKNGLSAPILAPRQRSPHHLLPFTGNVKQNISILTPSEGQTGNTLMRN